jgi:hypothetical protein
LYGVGTSLANLKAMSFTEFLIVYLACGSPFAVERLLARSETLSIGAFLEIASHLVGWPIVLLLRLSRVIASDFVSQYSKTNIELDSDCAAWDDSRRELSCLLTDRHPKLSVLQVRELLERYTGLASLARFQSVGSVPITNELFRVVKHPSPVLAAVCVSRRNGTVIQRHFRAARSEFLDLVNAVVDLTGSADSLLLETARGFVVEFDPIAAEHISLMIEAYSPAARTIEEVGSDRTLEINAANV